MVEIFILPKIIIYIFFEKFYYNYIILIYDFFLFILNIFSLFKLFIFYKVTILE